MLNEEQLQQLPTSPGVYIMKDAGGKILYLGKAANLRNRVRSYFSAPEKLSAKLQNLVHQVKDLEFFLTGSEQEALILELNLIKRHHPRYNVRLKDDKTFPYLKIDTRDEFPHIYITRRLETDEARYFGPFASAKSVRQTLGVIRSLFPFRSCTKPIKAKGARACLEYYIHNCVGPCIGAANRKEYQQVIQQVILFLEGKQERVVRELESRMKEASEALQFEKAALLRDRLQGVKRVIEGQQIATRVRGEKDVLAFAREKDKACVQVFFIRGGKLIGRENFILEGTGQEEPEQVMTSFVQQFYHAAPYIPPLILLQYPLLDAAVVQGWLEGRAGHKVRLEVPRRGAKKELVDIVAENARQALEQEKLKLVTPQALDEALEEVARVLKLPQPPARMEGYDISNIQGTSAVGSMVVTENGKPKSSLYRRFRIKTVSGADDYAMLQEVLRRRFKRAQEGEPSWQKPDLVLVDGGKGQLNAALEALKEAGVEVPVASLAKEHEEIFVPQQSEPIALPSSSPALQLLQRLRDEAHRFALGYYHRVHRKATFASALEGVPGLGSQRRRALLRHFGSVPAIQQAPAEELARVEGISPKLAQKIKEYL